MQNSVFGFPDTFAMVDLAKPAPGARSVSVVSTLSGGHVCTRSVEVYASPEGGRPRIVTRTSGDCGPAIAAPCPRRSNRLREPVRGRPGLIEVNDRPGERPAPTPQLTVGLR